MREIKFRGRMLTGEWVYGDLRNDIKGSTKYWDTCSQRICWECSNAPVKNGTVGQYTGLKDKNGTEIYEGDIHKYNNHHFTVKFGYYTDDNTHVEMYGWYLDSNSLEEQGSLGVDSEKYVNIIGNIHDKICTYEDSGCGSCEVSSEIRSCNTKLLGGAE